NHTTTYAYSARGQLVLQTDPVPVSGVAAPQTISQYDQAGNLRVTSPPASAQTINEYDAAGHVTSARSYAGTGSITSFGSSNPGVFVDSNGDTRIRWNATGF